MPTDAEQYGQTAEHATVDLETTGPQLEDEAKDQLAKTIEGSLAALGTDEELDEESETESEIEAEQGSDEESEEESDEESKDDSEDLADDTEAADEEPKKDSLPTLPEAYRRSLKAYGWTDDEINAAVTHDPEQFTATALRIHRTRNDEISKFADAGRRLRDGSDKILNQPDVKSVSDTKLTGLPVINKDALIEKYGNEEIVDAIVSPVNDAIAQMNQVLPELQAGIAVVRNTQQEALGKMIDGFFDGDSMKPYMEFYGSSQTERTPEQSTKFHEVLELADAILAGAGDQGRSLSFEEAMDAAHARVSQDFQAKAIRNEVKTKVKQRSKSLTLKPSHGGKKRSSDDHPRTQKELEDKTRAALAKVFT